MDKFFISILMTLVAIIGTIAAVASIFGGIGENLGIIVSAFIAVVGVLYGIKQKNDEVAV